MPTTDADSIPRIDYAIVAQIRQLESTRPGLAKHLVAVFVHNAAQFLSTIDSLIAAASTDRLHRGFHSLKGTAASLGALRLSHIAGIAETIVTDEKDAESLLEIAQCVRLEFEAMRGELARAAEQEIESGTTAPC